MEKQIYFLVAACRLQLHPLSRILEEILLHNSHLGKEVTSTSAQSSEQTICSFFQSGSPQSSFQICTELLKPIYWMIQWLLSNIVFCNCAQKLQIVRCDLCWEVKRLWQVKTHFGTSCTITTVIANIYVFFLFVPILIIYIMLWFQNAWNYNRIYTPLTISFLDRTMTFNEILCDVSRKRICVNVCIGKWYIVFISNNLNFS